MKTVAANDTQSATTQNTCVLKNKMRVQRSESHFERRSDEMNEL